MSGYALSRRADRDIESIARFTAERWGWDQAETYLSGLHEAFGTLSRFPEIGRSLPDIRSDYLRFEHASHSIFYRITPGGVLIVRVLHRRMLAQGRV